MSNTVKRMKKRLHNISGNKQIEYDTEILVHGSMIYECERCGRRWRMYLQKGIEEFGDNHKPSPFVIRCNKCGGAARDVSGIMKFAGGGYYPLPKGGVLFCK